MTAPGRLAALVVSVTLLAGCGVQPDSSPREVPDDDKAQLTGASSGGVASGADRIYLVGPGDERLLRSVSRDAASPDDLISILLRGPNEEESAAQYASVIPSTLSLLSTRLQTSVLYLDVTQELTELSGSGLVQALAQIVYTANELDTVSAVQLTVEGEQQAWPRGDLEFTLEPLTIYDYPGMVRTAQPAYPSVPSG
jgi:spore germination protein GerM